MEPSKLMIDKLLKEYTQDELARLLGVVSKSVYNYSNGVEPRKNTLKKIEVLYNQIHNGESPIPSNPEIFLDNRLYSIENSIKEIKESVKELKEHQHSLNLIEAFLHVILNQTLTTRANLENKEFIHLQIEANKTLSESMNLINSKSKI